MTGRRASSARRVSALRLLPRGRRALAATGLLALSAAFGLAALQTTSAGFTDQSAPRLGTGGAIGGSYNIAFLDAGGAIQEGDPTPLALDTSGNGAITFDATSDVAMRVVTTTVATGPVRLSLYNAYPGSRPSDPGTTGPGADPYDYALYTVTVDGTAVVTAATAAAIDAAPPVLTGWTQNTPKAVTVAVSLPRAIGNPYVFDRTLVLGVRFDGSTS
ncbi:hypothetical protein [Leifsonia shinshuensis]|uniref:Uncharacterized protein n=1 Tax=Leifsonia shinshuensis TaxID=150026 RepID=A0A7G6Y7A0_9MICO|nr:hypothetical protein [Leifsonia shinshuensis]QNE34365.1 hypothetical protein F1C12_03920 [Leifsonia shinshuensis]